MKIARSIPEVRASVAESSGVRVGFVPTMGALHRGHESLLRLARGRADVVVASVFVNPLQFGPGEDLDVYPRDEKGDLSTLEAAGVDIAFLPSVEEMYPPGAEVTVSVGRLGAIFEGLHRPGHLDGVATVVAKLFNIVQPDLAVFGQKDAQQVAVIRRLIADLDLPIELLVGPTIREPDGLALSSRNAYLSPSERGQAIALYASLEEGTSKLVAGETPSEVADSVAGFLKAHPAVEVDYVAVVDPETFAEPAVTGPVLIAVAANLGNTRLIDNVVVDRGTRAEA